MRLIDADKVIQSVDRQISMARELLSNDPQYQEFVSITEQCFKQEISNAPTVNAIPIEWLKNKSKDLADAYWNNVKNKLVLDMKDLPLVMDEIVRMWEKENEHKESD